MKDCLYIFKLALFIKPKFPLSLNGSKTPLKDLDLFKISSALKLFFSLKSRYNELSILSNLASFPLIFRKL